MLLFSPLGHYNNVRYKIPGHNCLSMITGQIHNPDANYLE